MIYFIGIGLEDPEDISLRGFEAVDECDYVYIDNYTSKLSYSVDKLEKLLNKKLILADRDLVENSSEILERSKKSNVAFLVAGDVFAATTHIALYIEAVKKNIKTKIIHNASIINGVGETGLNLYNFGKITSIHLDNINIKSPIDTIKKNLSINAHTLILLDIDTKNNNYLSINQALKYLVSNGIDEHTKVIAISQLKHIKYDTFYILEKMKLT